MNAKSFIVAILILLVFLGCSQKVETKLLILPNGKEIELQHIRPLVVGDGTKVLILTYVTEISIDDLDSVQREVDQIWPWYQKMVDEKGFKAAGISAANIVREGVTRWETRNYTFIYEKKEGSWAQFKRKPNLKVQQEG